MTKAYAIRADAKPQRDENRVILCARIPSSLKQRLAMLSLSSGVEMQALVRRALEAELERNAPLVVIHDEDFVAA